MKCRLNRRRVFWWVVGFSGVALSFSLWLWYRQHLPLPHRVIDYINKSDSLLWEVGRFRTSLIKRRFEQGLRNLDLAGSVWKDPDSGAVAEFGADGVFRWRHQPIDEGVGDLAPVIDGLKFRFDPSQGVYIWGYGLNQFQFGNLIFEAGDREMIGSTGFDGRHLVIKVEDWDLRTGAVGSLSLKFEQRIE